MYEYWKWFVITVTVAFTPTPLLAEKIIYFMEHKHVELAHALLKAIGGEMAPEWFERAFAVAVIRTQHGMVRALLRAGGRPTLILVDMALATKRVNGYCVRHVLGLLLAAGVSLENDETLDSSFQDAVISRDYTSAALILAANFSRDIPHMAVPTKGEDAMFCTMALHRKSAVKELELVGFGEVRDRLLEICVGLYGAELPTPILTLIVEFSCEPFASRLPYHYLWDSVIAVKHFRERRHAPAPQRGDLLANVRRTQDQFLAREKEDFEKKVERADELLAQDDFVGAASLLREILEVRRVAFGERYLHTLCSKIKLSRALGFCSASEESKSLILDVLSAEGKEGTDTPAHAQVFEIARADLDAILFFKRALAVK